MDHAGIALTTSILREHRQQPVVQHVRFMPQKLCKTHNSNGMASGTEQLTTCLKFTCANFNNCGVNFELPLALAIYIFAGLILLFWHTATEKRILSTNEPIIYHETCGDRTRYLKTETTLPVVSCPAGLFQATEIVSKNTIQWHGRGDTWPTEASWNRLHKSIFFRSNNN